jgi:integrase
MKRADFSALVVYLCICYGVLREHIPNLLGLRSQVFMNFVELIRDRKKIAQIKNLLRGEGRFRDLLLFVVGINTALRISDLLELQVGHFLDDYHQIKGRFWIKEQKKGKRQEVVVNDSDRETLEEYFATYPEIIGDQINFPFSTQKLTTSKN